MFKRDAKGGIIIGGMHVEELVEKYSSPLFIYNFDYLKNTYLKLRDALHSKIDLYYAVKANPNPHVVKQYLDLGAGLDLSSIGEVRMVKAQGANLSRTSFAGPGKTASDLIEALECGVCLSIESLSELEDIIQIADSIGKTANITLRINPSQRTKGFSVKMGGISSQFGIDQELLPKAIEKVQQAESVRIDGLHIYAGTQSLDSNAIVENIKNTLQIAEIHFENCGIPLKKINLGGGFGVTYHEGEDVLNEKELTHSINALADGYISKHPQTRLIIELGRYLVASSGVYVVKVVRKKVSRGSNFLILDGGMNHYLALSGNFGQIFRKNFPVIHDTKVLDVDGCEKYHLVGSLCTVLDRVGTDVQLPITQEGDLLVFPLAGAYAYTASPLQFLSHPIPSEIAIRQKSARMIRNRIETSY
jgi:diaminopimelate decarboxylase